MSNRAMGTLLVAGVLALTVADAAHAQTSTKTQDRLPVRVAQLDGVPHFPAGPDGYDLPAHPPMAPAGAALMAEGPMAEGPMFAGGVPPVGPCGLMMDGPIAPPAAPPPVGAPMGPPPGGPRDPLALARTLAAAETAIGIRLEQLNAWRDFTDALLSTLPRPAPRPPADGKKAEPPAPLSHLEAFADRLKAQGETGERLAKAIAALKASLTPAQQARMAALEPTLLPPPARRPGPPPPPGAQMPPNNGPRNP